MSNYLLTQETSKNNKHPDNTNDVKGEHVQLF